MVLTLENFWKNCTNQQYFEMLLHAKLQNLKTFKDLSFMQNQRLLKTFGRHEYKLWHDVLIFKDF